MGLHENMRSEPVSNLSLRTAVEMQASQTIRESVQAMRTAQLGCVVVVDDHRKPVGLFTEAMLRTLMAKSTDVLDHQLEAEMATTYPWAQAGDSIEMVVDAMEAKNARFVVVVDDAGQLAGLTGQKGLMEYVAEHFPGEVMVQRIGTAPYPARREGA
ncbi:MAG: CBS domain-containing protein [Planctomycetaceae bacterium]|nr:CBS domain-containing protein [Planctomycetaceae bacterium]